MNGSAYYYQFYIKMDFLFLFWTMCFLWRKYKEFFFHWIKHILPARREGRHEIKVSPLIPANAAKGLTACKLKQLYEGSLVKSFKQVYKYLWTFCRINTRFLCNSVFSLLKNYKNEETSLLFYKSILKD